MLKNIVASITTNYSGTVIVYFIFLSFILLALMKKENSGGGGGGGGVEEDMVWCFGLSFCLMLVINDISFMITIRMKEEK